MSELIRSNKERLLCELVVVFVLNFLDFGDPIRYSLRGDPTLNGIDCGGGGGDGGGGGSGGGGRGGGGAEACSSSVAVATGGVVSKCCLVITPHAVLGPGLVKAVIMAEQEVYLLGLVVGQGLG